MWGVVCRLGLGHTYRHLSSLSAFSPRPCLVSVSVLVLGLCPSAWAWVGMDAHRGSLAASTTRPSLASHTTPQPQQAAGKVEATSNEAARQRGSLGVELGAAGGGSVE